MNVEMAEHDKRNLMNASNEINPATGLPRLYIGGLPAQVSGCKKQFAQVYPVGKVPVGAYQGYEVAWETVEKCLDCGPEGGIRI